jgi:hypothetical protein
MDLIQLIIVIMVVGVLLWLVNTMVPMEPRVKQILNAVVIILLVLWLLQLLVGPFPNIHVGSPR